MLAGAFYLILVTLFSVVVQKVEKTLETSKRQSSEIL